MAGAGATCFDAPAFVGLQHVLSRRERSTTRARARASARGLRCPARRPSWSRERESPRAAITSRRIPSWSVITPSTPRSSVWCIVAWSLIVQTWTGRRARCAALRKRAVTIATGPQRGGTCRQSAPWRGIRPAPAAARASVMARGPIEVQARPAAEPAHAREAPVGERADTDALPRGHPLDQRDQRRHALVALGIDIDPGVGPAHERTPRAAARGSPRRGTGSFFPPSAVKACPASAASTSAMPSSAIAPPRSVTRSRRASWNATRTPSRARCTSVSR